MRVGILTLGTRGDLELFLILTRELRRRGHDVLIGTSPFFESNVRAAGANFSAIGNSTRDDLTRALKSASEVRDKTLRIQRFFKYWLAPILNGSQSAIGAIGATADYFVSNLKLGLRRGTEMLPSAAITYDPPFSINDLSMNGGQFEGRMLDLVAMPRRLADPDGRWPASHRFTGFWLPKPSDSYSPPDPLREFVESGSPPVVMTMGSMTTFDPVALSRVFAEALVKTNHRGVIVRGWSREMDLTGMPHVMAVEEAPYDWLFPRSSAVIHHGGTGTVGAVLAAGKPSILLPQIGCQSQYSQMLLREGLAAGVHETDTLTPVALADSILKATEEGPIKFMSSTWSNVSEEGGVVAATDMIERHLASFRKG